MSAHQTPAPMTEGEAGFGAGQTPASPTVPLGEAGPHSSDADAVGAPASEVQTPAAASEHGNYSAATEAIAPRPQVSPRWSAVDDDTSDLLSILSLDGSPIGLDEWPFFLSVLQKVADENDGLIDQNHTRPLLHGQIRPARTGAFFSRAARQGLIRPDGYTTTNNSVSGNGGKPAMSYRWLGT